MCGFVGVIDSSKLGLMALVESSLETIRHRGPDGSSTVLMDVEFGSVTLGHNRLAIFDLNRRSDQPMAVDGLTLVYNGEIYNYLELRGELESLGVKFSTTSDTEVLLQSWKQWGLDSIRRLDGMFAFCIVNEGLSKAWLVRDAFGIKPLYFGRSANRFAFGSEPRTVLDLLEKKPAVNGKAALEFLLDGAYDQGDETFYEEVFQVLPGELMEIDLSTLRTRHSNWLKISLAPTTSEDIESALQLSVSRQLRSDVPIAVALSGGIDSTILSAVARKNLGHEAPLHTFGFVPSDPDLSEEKWQILASKAVRSDHTLVNTPDLGLSQQVQEQLNVLGEPFGTTSLFAQRSVFSDIRKRGIKVSLDGQGADELFAGYEGYPQAKVLDLMSRGKIARALWITRSESPDLRSLLRFLASTAAELLGLSSPRTKVQLALRFMLVNQNAHRIVIPIRSLKIIARTRRSVDFPTILGGKPRFLTKKLAEEIWVRSLPALLKHADRNSMQASLESRVPYLSVLVAQSALSASGQLSALGQGRKVNLLQALRHCIPSEIGNRTDKVGFVADMFDPKCLSQNDWNRAVEALEKQPWIRSSALSNGPGWVSKEMGSDFTFRLYVLGSWLAGLSLPDEKV